MANQKLVRGILLAAYARKKAARPGYSRRALARDLGVSAAFVANLFAGKKHVPPQRLERICEILELDVLERESLVKSALLNSFSAKVLDAGGPKPRKPRKTLEPLSGDFLSDWMNVAVLEGFTLSVPFNEPERLRERLGLTKAQFARAVRILLDEGLLRDDHGTLKKADEHIYLAGGRTQREIRKIHELLILKARTELLSKTTDADYQRRLINGFTMAVNTARLPALKSKILKFLDELAQEAAAGECQDVYQCNLQFFPLTKST